MTRPAVFLLSALSVCWAQSASVAANRCGSVALAQAADALSAAFDDHQFVFLGSTHGDAKSEEFLTCLVTRPAFQRRVTDIVAEWASSGRQDLLDRYILTGDDISPEDLAAVMLDTDSPSLWTTLPPIRQTMRALRDGNRMLPRDKRIRLLGGNEGIQWGKVRTPEDLAPYPYKTNFMEHMMLDHLAKQPGNRTLVVYGDAHIHYRGNNFMGEFEATLGRAKLFVVGTVRELRENERAYLAALGDPGKPFFANPQRLPAGPWPNSLRTTFEEKQDEPLTAYIDGILYLGPEPDRDLRNAIPITPAQQKELDRRGALLSERERVMRARHQGKAQWFRAHPHDLRPRP